MAGLSLEGKPWYVGLLIGLVLAIAIVWGVNYAWIGDIDNQIHAADLQLKDLDTKIEQGRSAQRKLPQFREEVNRLTVELKKLKDILPSTRNTEMIIKKIKQLVDAGNFVLRKLTFPKLAAVQGSDPYAEWPISVSVDGRYHNLAILFNPSATSRVSSTSSRSRSRRCRRRLTVRSRRTSSPRPSSTLSRRKPSRRRRRAARNESEPIRAVARDRRRGDGDTIRAGASQQQGRGAGYRFGDDRGQDLERRRGAEHRTDDAAESAGDRRGAHRS